jgi:BlaI family penicillinase repressor
VTQRRISVPDAELAVLEVLWERGPATIREIAGTLYPDGTASERATVQKLLDRLEERGCATRRRRGRANVFRAIVERGDLIRARLRDAADRLCGGSLTPLLTYLVDAGNLTPGEVHELRRLVDRLDSEAGASREEER